MPSNDGTVFGGPEQGNPRTRDVPQPGGSPCPNFLLAIVICSPNVHVRHNCPIPTEMMSTKASRLKIHTHDWGVQA